MLEDMCALCNSIQIQCEGDTIYFVKDIKIQCVKQ